MIVITYATHKTDILDRIVNNEHNVDVKVLGMGLKWNGFMDKLKGVRDFCKTLVENEIVIYIDGFDSVINKYNSEEIENLFKKHACKILFSQDMDSNFVTRYINRRMFPRFCKKNNLAGCGMFMGYAGYLSLFFDDVLRTCKSNDDQWCINKMCNNYIAIDSNREIFQNIPFSTSFNKPSSAYFVSYPASMTFKRILRVPKEHFHTFLPEIILVVITLYFTNRHISLYFNILLLLFIACSYVFT